MHSTLSASSAHSIKASAGSIQLVKVNRDMLYVKDIMEYFKEQENSALLKTLRKTSPTMIFCDLASIATEKKLSKGFVDFMIENYRNGATISTVGKSLAQSEFQKLNKTKEICCTVADSEDKVPVFLYKEENESLGYLQNILDPLKNPLIIPLFNAALLSFISFLLYFLFFSASSVSTDVKLHSSVLLLLSTGLFISVNWFLSLLSETKQGMETELREGSVSSTIALDYYKLLTALAKET